MSAFKAALIVLVVSFAGHTHASVYVWLTDKTCPAAKPAVTEIDRIPFPQGWTVVIACNEIQWDLLQRNADTQETKHAFTNLNGRVTVVRGAMFLRPMATRPVHQVLLHEIGHIQCACNDESKAEGWAVTYERKDPLSARPKPVSSSAD